MAVKKNCKSKCIFFDFLGENLEIAPKQGKNGVEVVKVITFIRGVYEINNFIESQLYYRISNFDGNMPIICRRHGNHAKGMREHAKSMGTMPTA